jgi:orotidine-5'-phosphate decarboxylase
VFELVGEMAARAGDYSGEVGFVVGLTNAEPGILAKIPDAPLLLPGLGAQGGDLALLKSANRKAPIVINVSRGVMFGDGSFAARAKQFCDQIAAAL